jgi:hypothetical protein
MEGRNRSPMEERFAHLEERIVIEENDVEAELIGHPHDYFHASQGHADAVSLRDLAKHDLDVYEAQLNLNLRKVLNERQEKYTEAMINSMIICDQECIKLYEAYLDTKHVADLWAGMKEGYIQKGYMLKIFVDNRKSDNITEGSYSSQRRDALKNYPRRD